MRYLEMVLATAWQGLYENGYLLTEGHDVTQELLAMMLKIPVQLLNRRWVDAEWFNEEGTLPTHLNEVKFA